MRRRTQKIRVRRTNTSQFGINANDDSDENLETDSDFDESKQSQGRKSSRGSNRFLNLDRNDDAKSYSSADSTAKIKRLQTIDVFPDRLTLSVNAQDGTMLNVAVPKTASRFAK